MTLVNAETGEILDVEAAEMRASFICTDLDMAAASFETAMGRMREAIQQRDDIALGYRSPGDYLSDRFGGRLARLGVDLRREVVRELTEAGLSTRAIAPVLDISQRTVVNDQQVSNVAHLPEQTPEPAAGGEAVTGSGQTPEGASQDVGASEPVDEPAPSTPAPRPPVIGIDGKQYSRPEPRPAPTRDDFTEQDRAEELAKNLSRNLSLLYAVTNPERRAEYIATWRLGIRDLAPLGADFITPNHMRALADALHLFASEWENANV